MHYPCLCCVYACCCSTSVCVFMSCITIPSLSTCLVYRAWHHGASRFIIIIFFFLFLFFGVNKCTAKKPASAREGNLAHIMILKPHVQRHINITPVTFAAPRGGGKSNKGKQIRRFSTYIRRRVSEFRNGASVSKPEVEFQHGDRLFSDTGSSNISAVD